MNIKIITASAGSGKTYRLTQILDRAIADDRVRPEGVVALTFTKQAAAELVERARGKLLENRRTMEAHRLLAARIGTVNAVCGALVGDFAFELGMSPAVRVLDEAAAELEFRRAVARVVPTTVADELHALQQVFDMQLDWRFEVRRVVEAARANAVGAAALTACGARSKADLDACLGARTDDDLDASLQKALAVAIKKISADHDDRKNTQTYLDLLRECSTGLLHRSLRWGDWAKLAGAAPSKKLEAHAGPVQAIAARHIEHPRLRRDLHRMIDLVFETAGRALVTYQQHKRALGVIDFVDQETYALELLRRTDVRAALEGQIELFLVDEFQDTSPVQLAVFLELAALAKRSIWVGDPKQAIYGFRGTDPALMDAAIESLTSVTSDGDLIRAATDALAAGRVETLDTSYRSRPALVEVTSEIFARAFERHGMPADRTRLKPHMTKEPSGLGEIVEHWPLAGRNAQDRAMAAATGVRDLFARDVKVRGADGAARISTRADVAVLCRTNQQCRDVAAAFGELGIPAVVPRTGIVDTLEALVALAGLALWVDPRDAVAAAELARLISHPDDLDAFVARVLTTPGVAAFTDEPAVVRVLAVRAAEPDLGPVAVLDAILDATDLRKLCAEWGDSAQRLGNLDALRSHAVAYAERAAAAGQAATIVGLLAFLGELGEEGSWKEPRADSQALLAGENAVTISTWHAAKGLEWPVTVLFGLETMAETRSWGVHVLTERTMFDVADPLGGRWIRFWPNPYTTTNQHGPVRDAVNAAPAHHALCERAAREALRVLYVGWTRARDRLVFAAAPNKLLSGIMGVLSAIDAGLITEPAAARPGIVRGIWAGVNVDVRVVPVVGAEANGGERAPGEITIGNAPAPRALARVLPSDAGPVPCSVGEVVTLGPRLTVTGSPDMQHVGDAVHAFLAADRSGLTDAERRDLATVLLAGFGVGGCLDPGELVDAATRFWCWCSSQLPDARVHREWPVMRRTDEGTTIGGTADVVLVSPEQLAVIDHKTFAGDAESCAERATAYSGQLHAYATAINQALGERTTGSWVHFPVLGRIVELRQPGGTSP